MEVVAVEHPLRNISNLNEGRRTFEWSMDVGVVHPNGIHTLLGAVKLRRATRITSASIKINLYCDGMDAKSFELAMPPMLAAQGSSNEPLTMLLR